MTDLTQRAQFADYVRRARSATLTDRDENEIELIWLPKFALVTDVIFEVISVFGSTATVSVGLKGNGEADDPDAFLQTGDITQTAKGFYRDGSGPHGKGVYMAKPGVVTASISKGNSAATASGRVFVVYDLIH